MTDTIYFQPDLFTFVRLLKRHNDREWFAKNKERYLHTVVEPAARFIADFDPNLAKLSSHFVADPRPTRGSLFRIYRDIRFSADKRPFKTHIGMQFLHEKGKDAHAPMFYLHFEPGGCFAAGGVWHPDNPTLTKLRSAIVREPEKWGKVRRKVELEGDTLARAPRGFDPKHPFIADIMRKDFVASVELSDEQVCGAKLMRDFTSACKAMVPLVEFTTKALGLEF